MIYMLTMRQAKPVVEVVRAQPLQSMEEVLVYLLFGGQHLAGTSIVLMHVLSRSCANVEDTSSVATAMVVIKNAMLCDELLGVLNGKLLFCKA